MTAGSAITALNPTVTGSVSSYSVNPALPAGLALNTTSGVISGTPTAPVASADYVVTATNAGGSTTFNLQIAVNGAGQFLDSVVSGLSFTSGGLTGNTDADGRFTYEAGQNVTFSVGGVTLGSTAGRAIVTPLDLVPNSTSSTVAVQNLVRFLLLLDSDGDATNGITISDALRAAAENWPDVDFATLDLDAALATIIPDTQVDGTLRALPSAGVAQAHFEATFRCMFSGYFRGTYDGGDNGNFAFTILPDGAMAGAAYSVPDDELFVLIFDPPGLLQVSNDGVFAAGLAVSGQQTGSSFSGSFPAYNQVSGTWTDGTFSGTRYAGTPTAAYKILTLLRAPNPNPGPPTITIGTFFTEIDTAGAVTAESHVTFETGEQEFDLAVTQNGNELTFTDTNTNNSITGTLDLSGPSITGSFVNPDTGNTVTLESVGCRLR